MPQKSSRSSSSSADDSSRGAIAFDKTLDRREPAGSEPDGALAGMTDAAQAVTQDASQSLRPKVLASAAKNAADKADGPMIDEDNPGPDRPSLADSEGEDETDSTRSVGAVRSGAAMSAPRSAPSVPYVGIPRSLQKWDRYEVQAVLGAGGMGAVYRARDPRLNRMVALKIIHPMLGQDDDTRGQGVVRRFLREARLQASLEHPHICKIPEGYRASDGIA